MNKESKSSLVGASEEDYGPSYQNHVLSIYSVYVDMADRISSRREKANLFFLALNTTVISFVGYIVSTEKLSRNEPWLVLIAIAGVVVSYLWYRIIRSYRDLNTAKFNVIHEIETILPLKPYCSEWDAVGYGQDPNRYLPFTHIEMVVPIVFIILHGVVFIRVIPWLHIYASIGAS